MESPTTEEATQPPAITDAQPEVVAADATRATPSRRWLLHRVAVWSVVVTLTISALYAGLLYRKIHWELTVPIRFGDIQNGYRWGYRSAQEGYLNQYDKMINQEPQSSPWLDYAPLRLGVMTLWTKWTIARYGDTGGTWQGAYDFSAPVLWFNTAMELVAAVAAFLLVRRWIVTAASAAPPPRTAWAIVDWFRTRVMRRESTLQLPASLRVKPLLGIKRATAAALLVWFNPAIVLSAHVWPTWDMWIIPMYLLGVYLCLRNWWFAAGIVIGVGAMFKGQQLTVAPVFILWPLLQGRLVPAAKWALGVVLAISLVGSPWLLTYLEPQAYAQYLAHQALVGGGFAGGEVPLTSSAEAAANMGATAVPRLVDHPALAWVVGVVLASIATPLLLSWFRRRNSRRSDLLPLKVARNQVPDHDSVAVSSRTGRARRFAGSTLGIALIAGTILLCVIAWPVFVTAHPQKWRILLPFAGVITIGILLTRPRHLLYTVSAALAASLLMCMVVFHGSHTWWSEGVMFGARHWPWMIMGQTSNLPGIIVLRYGRDFGWSKYSENVNLPLYNLDPNGWFAWLLGDATITPKEFFNSIYVLLLVLCAIGVALQHRRRDPRFLAAITAPWVMMFTFPTQIHERYLLYAAGVGMVMIGANVGLLLLAMFMTFVTWIMTMHVMVRFGYRSGLGANLNHVMPELFSRQSGDKLFHFIAGTHPDIGWAVLLCAAIMLYVTLVPSRRERVVLLDGTRV